MTLIMSGTAGITTTLLLLLRRKKYGISWINMFVILLVVGTVGYFGAAFASYVSFDSWGGIRFYGKVLFVTIVLWILSSVLKIERGKIMDYYAPVDIFALIVMKINCIRAGCCEGIELGNGNIVFPSQMVELLVAGLIFATVIILEERNYCCGCRYSIYAILYGASRFVLDELRKEQGKLIDIGICDLSVTQMICILVVVLGFISIVTERRSQKYIDDAAYGCG